MRIPKSLQADLSLVAITLIWGVTFTLVKKSLAQVSPVLFIALRFWVATVVILCFMPGAVRDLNARTLRRGLVLALALLGAFVFQTLGLRETTPPRSAFMTSLFVPLVPILGYLLFRHRPTLQTLAGVMVATIGLGFLTLTTLELSLQRGDLLTLICAGVFALHILLIGRYVKTTDFRQLVLLQICMGALICTIVLPMLETPFLVWDVTFTLYLLLTGVFATALALYLQNRAQQFTTPNRTALIFSLEPVFAALFSYVLLGEGVTGREWLGGALVFAGILTSEIRRQEAGPGAQA